MVNASPLTRFIRYIFHKNLQFLNHVILITTKVLPPQADLTLTHFGVMVRMLASSVVDRGFIGDVMVRMLASSMVDRGFTGGVMFSMLASSVVDRGFIGGVMVSVLASSVVDRGFIGGIMVSVLASSAVDRGFEPRSDQTKDY